MRRLLQQLMITGLAALSASLPFGRQERSAETVQPGKKRVPLTVGQERAISQLRLEIPENPAPLFLFTDVNRDPDDLSVLILVSYLQKNGFLDLRCAVTTLGDRGTRVKRAKFAKGVLSDLGLQDVVVGVGIDYGIAIAGEDGNIDEKATAGRKKDHNVFIETPLFKANAAVEMDGLAMLRKHLNRVPDSSAVLLINLRNLSFDKSTSKLISGVASVASSITLLSVFNSSYPPSSTMKYKSGNRSIINQLNFD